MNPRFFGLDGEMSGSDIDAGHKLIQIGVAVDTDADGNRLAAPEVFCSLIGWPDNELPWDDAAASVHRIPKAEVLDAPRAAHVDDELRRWLIEHGAQQDSRRDQVMTGFNVGAFDVPFVRQALPRSTGLFSRRYADLNALGFALGASVPVPGGTASEASWKRHLRHVGLRQVADLGRTEPEHDAGTDALLALLIWRTVGETLTGLHRDATAHRAAQRATRKAAVTATGRAKESNRSADRQRRTR